jgi:hypothetical protein
VLVLSSLQCGAYLAADAATTFVAAITITTAAAVAATVATVTATVATTTAIVDVTAVTKSNAIAAPTLLTACTAH